MKNRVAVIGGGIAGLSTSLLLAEKGYQVDLYECTPQLGGQIQGTHLLNFPIDQYYHHIFHGDKSIKKLLKKLNIISELKFSNIEMGILDSHEFLPFMNLQYLMQVKGYSLLSKLKFIYGTLKLAFTSNNCLNGDISPWLSNHCGKMGLNKIWKPLLTGKFGNQWKDVSLIWLKERIRDMLFSFSWKGGEVGYFPQSFQIVVDSLKKQLKKHDVKILIDAPVRNLSYDNEQFTVSSRGNAKYDKVVLTLPPKEILKYRNLPEKIYQRIEKLQFRSAVVLAVIARNSFSPFYWLNIGDNTLPFGGVIEHTRLSGTDLYQGNHIIYFSRYTSPEDWTVQCEDETAVYRLFCEGMNKVKSDFSDSILEWKLFRNIEAQPLIDKNWSEIHRSIIPGKLYWLNGYHCFPRDRGLDAVMDNVYQLTEEFKGC